jgi:hypothetical protein
MSPYRSSNVSGKRLRPFASASGLLASILSLGAALVGVDSARAESQKAPTGPSYEETVAYLVDKFQQGGIPGNATHGKHGTTYTQDDTAFSISVEGCDSMTITTKTGSHVDDPSETPSRSDSATTIVTKIPFSSISMQNILDGGRSSSIPVVFSTHTVTTNPNNGADLADGFAIGAWDMSSFSIERVGGEWHDAVYIVASDSGVTWKSTGTEIGVSTGRSKPNVPLTVVPFWLPGTGATSTHVAKAIQHLVSLCINHSGQVPKEIF